MKALTANEAKAHFDELINKIQISPVGITHRRQLVSVMVSVEDYEEMRQHFLNRIQNSVQEVGKHAAIQGLTEEKLADLLADLSLA